MLLKVALNTITVTLTSLVSLSLYIYITALSNFGYTFENIMVHCQEKFKDTTGLIRSRKPKKDMQLKVKKNKAKFDFVLH